MTDPDLLLPPVPVPAVDVPPRADLAPTASSTPWLILAGVVLLAGFVALLWLRRGRTGRNSDGNDGR
jgi:LPXTG-motif cell wall-anchored protein